MKNIIQKINCLKNKNFIFLHFLKIRKMNFLQTYKSLHQNRHLKFRNLNIKNLQFPQCFQNQFEKNYENFFKFQMFEIWSNLNVRPID